MDGIASRDTRVKVHVIRPASLEATYVAAVTTDRAEQLAGLGRHKEPMEIGETKTVLNSWISSVWERSSDK